MMYFSFYKGEAYLALRGVLEQIKICRKINKGGEKSAETSVGLCCYFKTINE